MKITLSLPVIAIIVFILASQIWAWTRDGYRGYSPISDRGFAVLIAFLADVFFISLVGGIWLW